MSRAEKTKYQIQSQLLNCKFPDISYLETFYLLYWRGSHLLSQIKEGKIAHENRTYHVVFHKNLTRGRILQNPDHQYSLSFRKAKLSELQPVVLIWEGAR